MTNRVKNKRLGVAMKTYKIMNISEKKSGEITITTKMGSDENSLYIDVSDNGKGIVLKRKKDVFRPGYSSKKRGWGLGLSLARRIIEEYHQGKLYLKESKPFSKTTFRIILRT